MFQFFPLIHVFRISVNFRRRCIAGSQTVPYSTQTRRSEPHMRKNFGGVDIYIQVSPPETPGKGSKGFVKAILWGLLNPNGQVHHWPVALMF